MTSQQRLVLIIAILASFVAFLDGSVVNVALPAITRELGGGLPVQQWVVDAYLLTLGALMLLAGSISDLFGRQKVLQLGLIGFGIASVLCAIAPTSGFLIASRALQGIAGALLVPSSLAIIISTFSGAAQGQAIGRWTAWTGIAFLFGPLLGGFFVDATSWRLVFAINILPIAATLYLLKRLEKEDITKSGIKLDIVGSVLAGVGLMAAVYALIEQSRYGWDSAMIRASLGAGIVILGLFLWYEHRIKHPMLPLNLFRVRNFAVGNVATLGIYAGLSISTFLITIFVQQVGGYTAFRAGLALLPVTIIMFFLSPRVGALSGKYGPRWFMAGGPLLGALGFVLMLRVDSNINYWTALLPGIIVFGLGLTLTVSPLTSAVLGSIDPKRAGIASAVNNMVARVAGLIGIAMIGLATGPHLGTDGFHRAIVVTAVLLAAGGVVSAIGIENPKRQPKPSADLL
jgi:EmrB/QacA subfamily drug resistance transporter